MTAQVRSSMLRAAALITVLTVLARLAGFGRNLVFARTVGFNCLADTYFTVNTVPNILYEIVAGGALASLVVPLLAGAINRGDSEHADREERRAPAECQRQSGQHCARQRGAGGDARLLDRKRQRHP